LARQIAQLSDEQRAALAMQCPVTTCEGHTLSIRNQALIALQFPAATLVGGFRQWLKAGRAVRKGEHGFMIWIASGGDVKEDGTADETRFLIGTIFDVSQTDALEPTAGVTVAA
jgi:hypothetical protein